MREIDLLHVRAGGDRAGRPAPGEDVALAAEAARLQSADDLAAAARDTTAALAGDDDEAGGALAAIAAARASAERLAAVDPGATAAGGPGGRGRLPARPRSPVTSRATSSDLEVEPGRLEQIAERRYRLSGLTRKYGATCDEVLAWAEALGRAAERVWSRPTNGSPRSTRRIEAAARRSWPPRRRRSGPVAGRPPRRSSSGSAASWPPWRCRRPGCAFALTETELGPDGADQVDLLFSANPGSAAAQSGPGRLRRRAVPGPAGPGGGAGRRPAAGHVRLRRGGRRRRRQGRRRGRTPARRAGPPRARSSSSPTWLRWPRSPTGTSSWSSPTTAR